MGLQYFMGATLMREIITTNICGNGTLYLSDLTYSVSFKKWMKYLVALGWEVHHQEQFLHHSSPVKLPSLHPWNTFTQMISTLVPQLDLVPQYDLVPHTPNKQ